MKMDFKIGDSIEERDPNKKGMSNGVKMAIVITVSLITGVLVFYVTNLIFGPKKDKTPPVTTENLELTSTIVTNAYDLVTYGTNGRRNEKYLKEPSVTIESFTNSEKFYYAMMFAGSSDFSSTSNTASNNQQSQEQSLFYITNDKIKTYMQKYFGDKVTYTDSETVEVPLNFTINNHNVVTLKYDATTDSFFATFQDQTEPTTDLVEPYYYTLSSAVKSTDGNLELQEKVIYTDLVEVADDNYTLNLYSDYDKTKLLESRPNLTAESLSKSPINIENYKQRAATITYTFKAKNNDYYFVSSKIS